MKLTNILEQTVKPPIQPIASPQAMAQETEMEVEKDKEQKVADVEQAKGDFENMMKGGPVSKPEDFMDKFNNLMNTINSKEEKTPEDLQVLNYLNSIIKTGMEKIAQAKSSKSIGDFLNNFKG